MFKIPFILFFIILFPVELLSQIANNQKPLSFNYLLVSEFTSIELPKIPADSIQKLRKRNELSKQKSLVFAYVFETNILFADIAQVVVLPKGDKIYRLKISSQGAYSLNLTLENFRLPPNSKLFVYSADSLHINGSFTEQNNNSTGIFPISPIKGSSVIIEYYEPKQVEFNINFRISRIGHDFADIFGTTKGTAGVYGLSGDCNLDINCPEASDWQTEKNSVCKIIVNNQEICTGAFINNAKFDGTPYFLTANHCINSYYKANNTVFYFNYESFFCGDTHGGEEKSVAGAVLKATDSYIDFALVEVTGTIPDEYHLYLSGWNRTNTAPKQSYCIHHPNGDIKKLAANAEPCITGDYGEGLRAFSHWKVLKWKIGTTEKGSSGAPLFDDNHLIVGELTGGEANCVLSINDYFSKLYLHWDLYSEAEKQLKHWLDPDNTGVEAIAGYNPAEPQFNTDAQLYSILSPRNEYCNVTEFLPSAIIKNKGRNILENLTVKYQIDNQLVNSKQWQGSLMTNMTETIEFDPITLQGGTHTLKFWTEKPNQTNDETTANDTLALTFVSKMGAEMLLEISTDEYGNETSWELMDKNGVLEQYENFASSTLINNMLCLEPACYKLKIYDEDNDGMCCEHGNGFYRLINKTANDTLKTGGYFESVDSVVFCITKPQITDDVKSLVKRFEAYPNPSTGVFTIVAVDKSEILTTVQDKDVKMWVIDSSGRIVQQYWFMNQTMQINLSRMPEGLYFIRIKTGEEYYSIKVMVENERR